MISPLLLLLTVLGGAFSANILGINPTGLWSHQQPFLAIMAALAENGHQVTVITARPMQEPPRNMIQIDMSFTFPDDIVEGDYLLNKFSKSSAHEKLELLLPFNEMLCDAQFKFPDIKQLLRSNETFDVVVMELFMQWCYFGYIHELGSPPVVGFTSLGLSPAIHGLMGNPFNPAYMPDYNTPYTSHMSFWQRLHNTYTVLRLLYSFHNVIMPFHDAVIRKHFGEKTPSLSRMAHNVSLLLTANHYVTSYPEPNVPSIVQLTGLHIAKKRKPLPEKLQNFLDGAEHGFIYVSLGSLLRSSFLPNSTIRTLLQAFSVIPQRVVWKYEEGQLPWVPDNVMTAAWLPQQDVLAHRRIRLFITQGGLQSFNEAAYFGVPIIGLPVFSDQPQVVNKAVSEGVAIKLSLAALTEDCTVRAIREILSNSSYAENMARYSALYREHQETSLDRAVWWVEYVVRHHGAPHLRSAALDLHWWQLLLLDVLLAVVAVVAIVTLVFYKVLRLLISTIRLNRKIKVN